MKEVDALSDEQLAGQVLVAGFDGQRLETTTQAALGAGCLGGVILFARNIGTPRAVHALCAAVSAAAPAEFPPWIGVDQEGGRVRRLTSGVLEVPAARVLGAEGDVALTEEAAFELASDLRLLGFNLNFAPVADVDSNPDNPVIGDRAYSASPELVVAHARAAMAGHRRAGLVSCLKHYPGHGDTTTDSHLTLPVVTRSVLALRQGELYPFERLAPEAPTMMSAHVVFPALDDRPATLSPRLLISLLRQEFGFRGVLFSDDLEMRAVSELAPIEELAPQAILAGCDALLICSQGDLVVRARQALAARAASDAEFRARLRNAVERGLNLRRSRRAALKAWKKTQAELRQRASARRELQRRLQSLNSASLAEPAPTG